ncbi:MAG: RNA polymerase sigma factor [Chitinophagales bacterium]
MLDKNLDLVSAKDMNHHVEGYAVNNRESQKFIHTSFYRYAMTICERYTNNSEDAVEILNEGFLKIFKEIHHYKPAYTDVVSSFKGWLRKIYTAIDHFRKNRKHQRVTHLDTVEYQLASVSEDAVQKLAHKEIIQAMRILSPAYRTVLNLFVVCGLRHEEISEKLEISVGASKSNLSKAKNNCKKYYLTR